MRNPDCGCLVGRNRRCGTGGSITQKQTMNDLLLGKVNSVRVGRLPVFSHLPAAAVACTIWSVQVLRCGRMDGRHHGRLRGAGPRRWLGKERTG